MPRTLGALFILLWIGWGAIWAETAHTALQRSCGEVAGERIDSVEWRGLRRVKPEVVERENRQKVGEIVSCEQLQATQSSLEGLDLFATVRYQIEQSGELRIVRWHLEELPPWLPLPSAKISDQDGWLLGPSVIALNLWGRDVRLEAHARTTLYPDLFRAQEYTFSLSSPWLWSWPIDYDLRLIQTDSWNPLKLYDEESWEAGGEFAYRLYTIWSAVVWGEAFVAKHSYSEANWEWISSTSHDRMGVLGVGVRRDHRDRALDPRNGEWIEFRAGYGSGVLGNVGEWRDYLADLRIWRSWSNLLILHSSLLARYRPGDVPDLLHYHQGGINSLRGYPPDPERASRDELLSTIELRFPLLERYAIRWGGINLFTALQAVVGVDAARQGYRDSDRGYVGFYSGLHILLPGIDRLRIEGAWSKPSGFSIAVGLYEKSVTERWRSR